MVGVEPWVLGVHAAEIAGHAVVPLGDPFLAAGRGGIEALDAELVGSGYGRRRRRGGRRRLRLAVCWIGMRLAKAFGQFYRGAKKRADFLNKEIIKALKEMGTYSISIGIVGLVLYYAITAIAWGRVIEQALLLNKNWGRIFGFLVGFYLSTFAIGIPVVVWKYDRLAVAGAMLVVGLAGFVLSFLLRHPERSEAESRDLVGYR